MSTISPEAIDLIERTLQISTKLGIETFVIDATLIKAIDDAKQVVIVHEHGQELDFTAIGVARARILKQRLDLCKEVPEKKSKKDTGKDSKKDPRKIEFEEDQTTGNIRRLTISAGRRKVEFKCTNPAIMKVPSKIKDVFSTVLDLTPEQVEDIVAGVRAFSDAEDILIANSSDGLIFQYGDTNGDKYCIDVDLDTRMDQMFSKKYPLKKFIALLTLASEQGTTSIQIGTPVGMVRTHIDGITVAILPLAT